MSVTILTSPPTYQFVKNFVAFKVRGNNYKLSLGSTAFVSFSKTGDSVVGDTFDFDFLDISVHMSAVASPNDTGTQFTAGGSASQFAADLYSNYYISKYFIITYTTTLVTLVWKAGAGQVLNFSMNEAITGWSTTAHPGANPVYNTPFKLLCRTYIEDQPFSNDFRLLNEGDHDVADDETTTIQIQHSLAPTFRNHPEGYPYLDYPSFFNSSWWNICNYALKRYKCEFFEMIANTPQKMYASSILFVLNGKYPFDEWAYGDFFGNYPASKRFLTNMPDERITYYGTKQFLYFLCSHSSFTTITDIYMWVEIRYDDGSNFIAAGPVSSTAGDFYQKIIEFEVGAEFLDLNAINPTKTISYYTIYLSDDAIGANVIAGPVLFRLIPEPWNKKEFIYKNRYGVFETLIAEGFEDSSFEVSRIESEINVSPVYRPENGYTYSQTTRTQDIKHVLTGKKTEKECEVLREMLESDWLLLAGPDGWIRCILVDGTFKINDEGEDMFSIEFSYKPTGLRGSNDT